MLDLLKLEKDRFPHFTYADWARYFEGNARAPLEPDFSREPALLPEVRRRILPSIGAFRQGEASEGQYLHAAAQAFARQQGEPAYPQAIALFIKEENRHAGYLARFMEHHKAPAPRPSGLDRVFRWLRRQGGLRCQATVLVTAEMLALTYYDALGRGSGSPALQAICKRMLQDEGPHVVFQSYTLGHYKNTPAAVLLRRGLMNVTALALWCACHRVYRAGGCSFSRLMGEARGYLGQSIQLTKLAEKEGAHHAARHKDC